MDLIDCSSGGNVAAVKIPVALGNQVPFAETIRREAGLATGAESMSTEPAQADQIVASAQADVVFLARQFLRDPCWPLIAARALGHEIKWPVPYERAKIKR